MNFDASGGALTSGDNEDGEDASAPTEEEIPTPPMQSESATPPDPAVEPTQAPVGPESQAPQDNSGATSIGSPALSVEPSAGDPAGNDEDGSASQSMVTQVGLVSAPDGEAFKMQGDQRLLMATSAAQQESAVVISAEPPAPAPLVPQPSGPIDVLLGLPAVAVNMLTGDEDLAGADGQAMLMAAAVDQQGVRNAVAADPPQPAPIQGLVTAVVDVAAAFVNTLFAPFLFGSPAAPAEPPFLWALLAWVRQETQRRFFNTTPVAVTDPVTTSEDASAVINVLANDTDVENDDITVTSFTDPPHGSVVQNPDGTLTYTPDANYAGPDSFTYTVSDGGFHVINDLARWFTGRGPRTSTATVAVTVTAVNDAPIARDDTSTTQEDTVVTIGVLGNDTDVDGGPLTPTVTTAPASGTTAVNPNGTITYTPTPEFTGTDTFTYTVTDGNGSTDTATVSITVTPVNDAPTAGDDEATTDEGTPVTISVLSNDTDIDGGPLTPTVTTAPGGGTAAVNADGTITYTPGATFAGEDSFIYTVSDGRGGTDTATVSITVSPVNHAPTVSTSTPPTIYSTQGIPVRIDPDLTVTDPDSPALSRATITIDNPSPGDTLSIEGPLGALGATFSPARDSLQLSGNATVAEYQAVMRSIAFSTTSEDTTPRTITFLVQDTDLLDSPEATRTITLTDTVRPDLLIQSWPLMDYEPAWGAVIVCSPRISDSDSATMSAAAVAISGGFTDGDVLGIEAPDGVSAVYDHATGVLTLTGTATTTEYQTLLDSITFSTADTDGLKTLTYTVTDDTGQISDPYDLDIFIGLEPPVVTTTDGSVTLTANDVNVIVDPGLTITDNGSYLMRAAVVYVSGFESGDLLTYDELPFGNIKLDYNDGYEMRLEGDGTVAEYQEALRSIVFSATNGSPRYQREIYFTVEDSTNLISTAAIKVVNIDF